MSDAGVGGQPRVLRHPPFARPMPPVLVGAADPPPDDDYPPIEQFLDDLPSIDDYLDSDDSVERFSSLPGLQSGRGSAKQDEEGWTMAEWQSYDLHGLASLGRVSAEGAEAEADWGATEWSTAVPASTTDVRHVRNVAAPGVGPSATASGPTSEEVAAALVAIAGRIRSGELSIDKFRGTPPEAAMAAALAAMLRMRG